MRSTAGRAAAIGVTASICAAPVGTGRWTYAGFSVRDPVVPEVADSPGSADVGDESDSSAEPFANERPGADRGGTRSARERSLRSGSRDPSGTSAARVTSDPGLKSPPSPSSLTGSSFCGSPAFSGSDPAGRQTSARRTATRRVPSAPHSGAPPAWSWHRRPRRTMPPDHRHRHKRCWHLENRKCLRHRCPAPAPRHRLGRPIAHTVSRTDQFEQILSSLPPMGCPTSVLL